ncbi:hypothetical protein BB560_003534, partial [Smittium megazygosporum]
MRNPLLLLSSLAIFVSMSLAQELEGAETHESSATADTSPLTSQKDFSTFRPKPEDYNFEMMVLVFIVFYLSNYLLGRAYNLRILSKLERPIGTVLRRQFHLVADPGGLMFDIDSWTDIFFWATGRRNCESLRGIIKLKPRQDMIGMIQDMASPHEEYLTLEFDLPQKVPNFVFAIVPKVKFRTIIRDRFDINTFSKPVKVDNLSSNLIVLSENNEVATDFINSNVYSNFARSDSLLQELYISDQPEKKPTDINFVTKKVLAIRIKIPTLDEQNLKLFESTLEYAMYLVDYIANKISLPSE